MTIVTKLSKMAVDLIAGAASKIDRLSDEQLKNFFSELLSKIGRSTAGNAELSQFSIEVSTVDGKKIWVNEIWNRFFGDTDRAVWADWALVAGHVKLDDPKRERGDYFIPFGSGWEAGTKRLRSGGARLLPLGQANPPSRVFGYASHQITAANKTLIVSFFVDQTAAATAEDDLAGALEAAATSLEAIYKRSTHRSNHFSYFSKPYQKVSGDFIFFRRHAGKTLRRDILIVGDCAGKRMSAALQCAIVGSALNRYIDESKVKEWSAGGVLEVVDDVLCRLVRTPSGDSPLPAAFRADVAEALWDMGADGCALIFDRGARVIEYASAQIPIYLITKNGKGRAFSVSKFGNDDGGKCLGPARIADRGVVMVPPAKIERGRIQVGAAGYVVAFSDGFGLGLEQALRGSGCSDIETFLQQTAEKIPRNSAGFRDCLVEKFNQGVEYAVKRDDSALAVLSFGKAGSRTSKR